MSDMEQPAIVPDSVPADAGDPLETTTTEAEAALLTQQAEPEEVEEDFEGVKLKGKKDLLEEFKKGRMLHSDYTRKTQEVADQRKAFESERTRFQETAKSHQEHIREVGRLVAIEERLGQYAQVNWQAWADQDAAAASKAHMEFTQLQAQRGQLVSTLTQKEQQRRLEAERTSATRANEAEAIVMREVKDWGPEKLGKFRDAAQKAGIEPEGLRQMLIQYPGAARFLDKALKFDQLLAARMQKPPVEPVKPATRIGGSAAANTKPLGDVTDPQEWAERRRQRKSQTR